MNKKTWRLSALISLLLLITSCQNPPPAENSCNFVQNAFKRRVSWASLPVKFYIDKGSFAGPDEDKYYMAIKEAMDVWNEKLEINALELIGRTDGLPVPRLNKVGRVVPDQYNGIYRVDKDVFENTNVRDEQARTSISFKGDFIYEADVLVDGSEDFYFEDKALTLASDPVITDCITEKQLLCPPDQLSSCHTQASQSCKSLVQFKSLMIHEFGHVLGLGHIDDASLGSVMFPRLMSGQMRPAPITTKSAEGEVITTLELPEVDQESLSCEYQLKE